MSTARVGIVIPTHNGRDLLEPCLAALHRQSFRDFTVRVVDNGSTDGTREWLAQVQPNALVISFKENRGFSVAINAGIRAGSEPLVVSLNNDVFPEADWLAALVARADAAPEEYSWSSALVYDQSPEIVESAGLSLFRDGTPAILNRGKKVSELPEMPMEILGAYGGAAMYRRSLLDEIGLFDERFIFYGEDMDLALRARLAGRSCALVPMARARHRHMATSRRTPNRSAYLQYRNIVLYLVKNLPAGFLARRLPRFALTGCRPILTKPWMSLGWVLQLAKLGILWNLPWALLARRRIRRNRRITDEALFALFAPGTPRPHQTGWPWERDLASR
ncbi:MAG: glycosyltransferase family 2 protein [Planctomycetes bacterium]|nr:glycosyltransferase family 2 protein [Planctomycetota bacterium]